MTDEEYREFKADLVAAFPRLFQWLNSECPAQTREATENRWQQTLCQYDLVDAKAALDHFYVHPEQLERKRLEAYVPIMAAEAGRLGAKRKFAQQDRQPRYIDGEQVYQCYECQDYGVRIVWSETSKRIASGKGQPPNPEAEPVKLGDAGTLYSMAVACTCAAGDCWAERMDPPLLRFNATLHLPVDDMADPDEQAALIEFVRPKGHQEFAAFAGGQEG